MYSQVNTAVIVSPLMPLPSSISTPASSQYDGCDSPVAILGETTTLLPLGHTIKTNDPSIAEPNPTPDHPEAGAVTLNVIFPEPAEADASGIESTKHRFNED